MLSVAFIYANTGLGVLFGACFIAYEIVQSGNSHLDIKSFLWGVGIAGVVWLILEVVL